MFINVKRNQKCNKLALIFNREITESNRFPGNTAKDSDVILYGAEDSVLFPGLFWGGMTANTAIYLQNGVPSMQEIENR